MLLTHKHKYSKKKNKKSRFLQLSSSQQLTNEKFVSENHNQKGSSFSDLLIWDFLLQINKKPTVLFTTLGCYGHMTTKARLNC